MPREDAEAAAIVHQALCRDGVQVTVGAKIVEVATRGALKIVRYTDPQIAHVGLTAAQAEAAGLAVTTFVQPLQDVDRAVLDGETEGFAKVHAKQGTGTIVGATIVARYAGEMIGLYTTLMTHKLGLGALIRVIQPYPTQAEAVRKTRDVYQRTRLTPFVKKLMAHWFAWQRGP
jgi:pyruvate/2-oxoglutarate dehydrogenase complex dihydrolipoamide dehydrogenase (E3) component